MKKITCKCGNEIKPDESKHEHQVQCSKSGASVDVPAKEFEPFWLDEVQSQVILCLDTYRYVPLDDENLLKLLERYKYPLDKLIASLTNTGLICVKDNALHLMKKCLVGGVPPRRGFFIGDDTYGQATAWLNNPNMTRRVLPGPEQKIIDDIKAVFSMDYEIATSRIQIWLDHTNYADGNDVSDTMARIDKTIRIPFFDTLRHRLADKLFKGKGVEFLRHELAEQDGYWAGAIGLYINRGDVRKTTIIFDTIAKKFRLASCAEVLENFEAGKRRAGYKQDKQGRWITPSEATIEVPAEEWEPQAIKESIGDECLNCGQFYEVLPTVCIKCNFRDVTPCPWCGKEVSRINYLVMGWDEYKCPACGETVKLRLNPKRYDERGNFNSPAVIVKKVT